MGSGSLLSSSISPVWCVSPFQSAQQWSSSSGAPQVLGRHLPPAGPCTHSTMLLLPLPSVCASGGHFGCLVMGCGSAADCTWKQLCNSTEPAIQLLLSPPDAMQSSCCLLQLSHLPQELLHLAHLWQAGLLSCPCLRRSLYSPSAVWVLHCSLVLQQPCLRWRHWPLSAEMVQIPHQSCSLALRWVPSILPWESGGMSAPDLCRWLQNGAWLLVDFTCLHLASGRPSSALSPSLHTLPRKLLHHDLSACPGHVLLATVLTRAAYFGKRDWPPFLLASHMPGQSATLIRAAGSWWVSVLSRAFPGWGRSSHCLWATLSCSAVEHTCTRSDHLCGCHISVLPSSCSFP